MASTYQNTTACMSHYTSHRNPFPVHQRFLLFSVVYWIFWHTYCNINYTKWKQWCI